jgi:hypothetical protein
MKLTAEQKKLKEQCMLEFRAVSLVFEYYRYFMNIDTAKRVGHIICGYNYSWSRNSNTGNYIYTPVFGKPCIYLTTWYKCPERRAEVNRLKQLLMFSPDMVVEEDPAINHKLIVKSVNLDLPSIKNNSIGFERKV